MTVALFFLLVAVFAGLLTEIAFSPAWLLAVLLAAVFVAGMVAAS